MHMYLLGIMKCFARSLPAIWLIFGSLSIFCCLLKFLVSRNRDIETLSESYTRFIIGTMEYSYFFIAIAVESEPWSWVGSLAKVDATCCLFLPPDPDRVQGNGWLGRELSLVLGFRIH